MHKNLKTSFLILGISASGIASNGPYLVGVHARSQGMGGTGVSLFNSSTEALNRNVALLADSAIVDGRTNLEATGTYFNNAADTDGGLGARENKTPTAFLPSFVATRRFGDRISVGLGVLSNGGGKFDRTGNAELVQLRTYNSLTRLIPGVSYKLCNQLSFGAAPVVEYGQLQVNEALLGTQSSQAPHGSVGVGGHFGVSYRPTEKISFGATYTSKIGHNYNSVVDLDRFGPALVLNTAALGIDDVKLQQPQEIAIGAGWASGALHLAADYRFINWSGSDLFRELGWNDQHVIAIGAQYDISKLALRLGFNYGSSPIKSVSGENGSATVDIQGHQVFAQSISLLNIAGFPAISQTTISAGAGYSLSDDVTLDLALQYSPSTSQTRAGTGPSTPAAYSYSTTVKQFSAALSASYRL